MQLETRDNKRLQLCTTNRKQQILTRDAKKLQRCMTKWQQQTVIWDNMRLEFCMTNWQQEAVTGNTKTTALYGKPTTENSDQGCHKIAALYDKMTHANCDRDTTILQFSLMWGCDPTRVMAASFLMFLDHTQRRSTVGRTPLDKWSARRRDLYLTTHNTHDRHPCPPVVFDPTISAGERPQTYALDRAAAGTGTIIQLNMTN
jgi:hypothetical protein